MRVKTSFTRIIKAEQPNLVEVQYSAGHPLACHYASDNPFACSVQKIILMPETLHKKIAVQQLFLWKIYELSHKLRFKCTFYHNSYCLATRGTKSGVRRSPRFAAILARFTVKRNSVVHYCVLVRLKHSCHLLISLSNRTKTLVYRTFTK